MVLELIVLAVVLGCVVLVAGIAALGVVEAVAMTVQAARGLAPVAAVVPVPAVVMVPAVALVGVTDVRVTVQLLAAWTAAVVLGVVLDVVGAVRAVAIGPELPMAKINYLFSLDFTVDFHKVVTTMYPILKEE